MVLAVAGLLSAAAGVHAQAGFPIKPVGSPATQTVTVTAQASGTVSRIQVLTSGNPNLEFVSAGSGSCTGASLSTDGTCTVPVTFTPAYPGLRQGAVVLLDSGNLVLGTALLNGIGSGGLGLLVPSNAQALAGAQAQAGAGTVASLAGVAQTIAGDGKWQDSDVGDGNPATQAELYSPSAVVVDGVGNVYIADSGHDRIRMVCAGTTATIAGTSCPVAGNISTIAGVSGVVLKAPTGLAIDGSGNLYVADSGNHVIREISAATGAITTIAGTGSAGSAGDGGPATDAELSSPFAVALDAIGNLFIADNQDNRIRAVCAVAGKVLGVSCAAPGDMVTVAGTGAIGASGDGGQAIAAQLSGPYAVALDASGDLFIADTQNNRIRAVCASSANTVLGNSCSATGNILTVAGDGTGDFLGDGGPAPAAEINSPSGLTFDPAGNLYIADTQNGRIRKVNAATGVILTLAGTGSRAFGGDGGPALAAGMYGPYGLAFYNTKPQGGGAQPIAHFGDLLIAAFFDQRIREIESGLAIVDIIQPVRQGFMSPAPTDPTDPTLITVENDGNAALDLTTLVAGANTAIGTQSIPSVSLCSGRDSLTVETQCAVEPIFAPAATPPLTTNTQAETGDIDVNNDTIPGTTSANSPLVITIDGTATLVNPTTVSVSCNPNPSDFGKNVTCTATVAIGSGSGTPTGTVTFFDGTTQLGSPATIGASGAGTLTISTLTVGIHSITATYNGDSNDTSSTSSAWVQTVDEQTATTVKSSANPSALNSALTFTATVTAPSGGGVNPDGTVTFLDGATALATVPLTAGGTAQYTISTLTEGPHSITATYSGDLTKFVLGSASPVLTQDVLAGSTIALTSSPNPSNYGISVVFTATLTSSGTVAPTGIVTFLDGGNPIGTGAFAGATGVATATISTLAAGSHTITASYAGDTNIGPGISNAIAQTVNPTQTNTTLTAAPSPGIAGKPVVLSATVVVVAGSATVTGPVTFTDGATTLGTAQVGAGGVASTSVSLAPGVHSIVATYGGDANDKGSASIAFSLTINQATTQVALTSSGSPAVVLSAVTFKAIVSGNGGTPTGAVSFVVDGTSAGSVPVDGAGTANLVDSGLAVGSHTVVAAYSGDTDDASSSSGSLPIVITAIPTTTDLGASSTGGATPQAILVATTLATTGPAPTGTITFNNGSTVIGSATLNSSGVATLVPDLAPGSYSIVASYSGDSLHSPSSSAAVSISGTAAGFSIDLAPPKMALVSGQNGSVTISVISNSGFSDSIGMGCLSLPAAVNCHFSTNTVKLGSGQTQTLQLTIDTNAPLSGGTSSSLTRPGGKGGLSLAGLFLPVSLFFGWLFWRWRRRHVAALVASLALFLAGAVAFTGCGAGFSQVTAAPGTYSIQVGGIGSGSNISHYQIMTLTVTK
ncbi:MAG TPA: Ig-like domain repeat protein [Terracidiphilus sp.]|jgi:sugar lactone lactonase YvrE|nr:Ig-like domain repeat protein [Terracidiphilus sp.]